MNAGIVFQARILAEYWPQSVFGLTHSGLRNTFVAEITNGRDLLENGDLILIQYLHNWESPDVVATILQSAVTEYRVSAQRDRSCDHTLGQLRLIGGIDSDTGQEVAPVSALRILPGADNKKLDQERSLECYTVESTQFVPVPSQPHEP